jgi:hypothetical protein
MLELEIKIDPRGEINIENLEMFFETFPGTAMKALSSAMKSEGYRLSQILKIAARALEPKLNPHTGIMAKAHGGASLVRNFRTQWRGQKGSKTRYREYWGSKVSSLQQPISRMANAIGYTFDETTGTLDISFQKNLGSRANRLRYLMHKQAEGGMTIMTPRMRRMLFAMGFPVTKGLTSLIMPQRPLFQPVFDAQKDTIIAMIQQKFNANIQRYMPS